MTRRYRDDPAAMQDGRNVNPGLGVLLGEGAQQQVKRVEEAFPAPGVTEVPPVHAVATAARPTYYGQPVLKAPVWIWTVPVYFYMEGLAGAAGALAGAVTLTGDEVLRPFVRRLRWVSVSCCAVSGGLLIADLGRPSRFLNMLRVFRPTSPMSMGAWMLAAISSFSGIAALLSDAPGALRRVGDAAGYAAAVVALPFTGYTAVLVNNTAVPVWQSTRRSLPFLFTASSMTSLSSLLQLTAHGAREQQIARRFGVAGRIAELVSSEAVERDARKVPEVARPLAEGRSGALWKAGRAMAVASLALSLLPARVKWARTASAVLGTAAALSTKLAVFQAGRVSSRNPHATFDMQRAGRGAAEVGHGSSNLVQLKVEGRLIPLDQAQGPTV